MIWVTEATYIKDYMLLITFNDGVKKVVDLQNELDEGVFSILMHKDYFKNFHISVFYFSWLSGV